MTPREIALKCAEICREEAIGRGDVAYLTGNKECERAIRAFANTLPSESVAIPNGWKLVPREPVKEQREAVDALLLEMRRRDASGELIDWIALTEVLCRAMLAAAPSPTVNKESGSTPESQEQLERLFGHR